MTRRNVVGNDGTGTDDGSSPIVTPFVTTTLAPIHTFPPIVMALRVYG
jgi:hypothetical protein